MYYTFLSCKQLYAFCPFWYEPLTFSGTYMTILNSNLFFNNFGKMYINCSIRYYYTIYLPAEFRYTFICVDRKNVS